MTYLTLPPTLCSLLKLKNHYRRRYQRIRLPIIITCPKVFSTQLSRLQNTKWASFLRTLHPQSSQFWKIAHYFMKPTLSIPPLIQHGKLVFHTPLKVEELARQFEQSHHLTLNMGTNNHSLAITRSVNRFFRRTTPQNPQPQLTNHYEVRRKILSLKPQAALGEDGITSIMPCNLSGKALTYLTQLFNHLLSFGFFPNTWKRAKIIPIPKPNKPTMDPNSYRPISLLSIVGKLFEQIIASQLITYINQQHLLPHEQFGFRKKHSTVSQLAQISNYISNGYNLHKHSGMVLLDLEKAYDTVWIHGLLHKLISLKLPKYLIFILRAFLEGRSFTVHLNDASSTPKNIPSSLPQGAVLSTTLFAIYISDMSHPPNTQLALYADDTAFLMHSWQNDTIAQQLIHCMTMLHRHFTKWKLRVNINKTEATLFTKRRPATLIPL